MVKRKPRRWLSAASLPQVRSGFQDSFHQQVLEARRAGRPYQSGDFLPTLLLGLADAQLWYVSRPMAELAYHAKGDLPEWSPSLARPAPYGMVFWEGGTGFSVSMPEQGISSLDVDGMIWLPTASGMDMMALTLDPRAPRPVMSAGVPVSPIPAVYGSTKVDHHGQGAGLAAALWSMLGATWLLADQPTIATQHRRQGFSGRRKPALPSEITVVTLREGIHDPTGDRGEPGAGTTLTSRHLVRGHWRQQACGHNREQRKPVYVQPYIKGPQGAELKLKDQVHIWRR